jgi:DHA2 family multidrug resistance protein
MGPSYLAANAIILPMFGWLALRLGRRNYFLLSIAIFTLASALCGTATSLDMLIGAARRRGPLAAPTKPKLGLLLN